MSWSLIAHFFGPLTSFDDNLQHSNNHLSKSSTLSVFLTTCLMSLAILCCYLSSIDRHLSTKYFVPNVILPRLFFLAVLGWPSGCFSWLLLGSRTCTVIYPVALSGHLPTNVTIKPTTFKRRLVAKYARRQDVSGVSSSSLPCNAFKSTTFRGRTVVVIDDTVCLGRPPAAVLALLPNLQSLATILWLWLPA